MISYMQGEVVENAKEKMEIVRVGIYVSDIYFGRSLARALAIETRKMEFILTDREYIGAEGLFDLVLADDPEAGPDICLREEQQEEIYLQDQPYSVYRYLNSCKMAEALQYVYYRKTGRVYKGQKRRNLKVISGVSDRGESGLSLSLRETAKAVFEMYNARCLFFSLCPYNHSVPEEGKCSRGSFLKLMYYMKCKEDFSIDLFINETDSVDFMAVESLNPAYTEITEDILTKLIQKVEETGKYDYLIGDIGNNISVNSLNFVAVSDAVIFAENTQSTSTQRLLCDFLNGPLCFIKKTADNSSRLMPEGFRSDFIETRFNRAEGERESYGSGATELAEWIVENT